MRQVVVLIFSCGSGLRVTHPRRNAHPVHGVQQLWGAGAFHLFAQIAEVDVQGVRVAHERATPDPIQDLLAAVNRLGLAHQETEQFEFPLRQVQLPLAPAERCGSAG